MGRTERTEMVAVADSVDRLSMWLRRQVPAAVSSSTITTLDTLHSNGPLRVSELAEREAVSQPGMTTLINRLEAAGQAVRTPDPSDGRASLVAITETGRAILRERHSSRVDLLVHELLGLSADDRAALLAAVPAIDRLITRNLESVSA